MILGCGMDSSGTLHGPMTGTCEHGNEISSFLNGRKFFDELNGY
jgi:hypothetical protein